ncbi:MAG: hypothetical protein PHE83_18160 [Opitutaceae bacterium]|nr:hypothetical protein [Opitutaceae bacterium]
MRDGDEIRRYPLHDYLYHVVYRPMGETIIIVAVAHQRRRPGNWSGRR